MRRGRVSKTALKVALVVLTLADRDDWGEPLPERTGPLTEALLLAADQPLYRGGTIRLYRSRPGRWMADRVRRTYAAVARRRSFMDRQVREALAAGASQVLVLGAGFDTLCLRLAPEHPRRRFVEIDHPGTAAAKARGLERIGWPDNLQQLPVDLGARPLSQALAELEGWDPTARTVVVAEGLLMYLSPEQCRGLFAEIARCTGDGSRVCLSHLLDLSSFHPLMLWALRWTGEPWLSSWTQAELPGAMSALGWRVRVQDRPEPRDVEGCACVERDRAG
jgi:methyltransferase (TIGR00027 family)